MELVRRSLYCGFRAHHIFRHPKQLTALRLTRNYCVLSQISPTPQFAASQQFNLLNITQIRHLTDLGQSSDSSIKKALAEADNLSITHSNIKFVTVDDTVPAAIATTTSTIDVPSEIKGAIIPFSELNFFQEIFFFYQYPTMYYLDFLLNFMPWWASIIGITATIRLLFFPLVLKMNIIGIKIANIMPETQKIQVKMNEAMCSGDNYGSTLQRAKLKALYAEHNISIMQRLLPTLIQTPSFVCLFFTLRQLADYYKLDSMTTGGALWFTNLTVPDPFYVLPLITCGSMFLLMRYGVEGSSELMNQMGPAGRWFMRLVPVGLFAIVHSFPSAVLLFWTTNNIFTLSYSLLLKNSSVKRKFNIPNRIEHKASDLPLTNQTFSNQIRSAYESGKSSRTSMDVRRLDDIAFRRAGVEPLRKTYKTPPSEQS